MSQIRVLKEIVTILTPLKEENDGLEISEAVGVLHTPVPAAHRIAAATATAEPVLSASEDTDL